MKNLLRIVKHDVVNNFYHIFALCLTAAVVLCATVGILVAKPRVLAGADSYYNELRYWDIKISAQSLGDNVINAVKNDSDVQSVYSHFSSVEKAVLNGEGEYNLTIYSVNFETLVHNPQSIPICPTIVRGTYPKSTTGCLAILPEEESNALKIGDKITINAPSEIVKQTEFTVTGVATSPLYTEGEIMIYVVRDVFSTAISATDLLVNLKSCENISTFSGEYENNVRSSVERIKQLCISAQSGEIDITDTAENQLIKAQKEYEFLVEQAKTDLDELTKNITNMETAINALNAAIAPKQQKVAEKAETINAQKAEIDELIAKGDAATDDEKKQIEAYNALVKEYEELSAAVSSEQATLDLNKTTYEQLVKDKVSYKQISDEKIATAKARVETLQNGETLSKTAHFTGAVILDNPAIVDFASKSAVIYKIAPFIIVAFGLLLMVATAYVVYRIFDKNRKEMALFSELNIKQKILRAAFVTLSCSVLGSAVGIIGGVFLLPRAFFKYFSAFAYQYAFVKPTLLTTLIPVIATIVLVALVSVGWYLLLVKFLPETEKKTLVKLPKFLNCLSAPTKLIIKNGLQYKKRYIMPLVCATIVQVIVVSAWRFGNGTFAVLGLIVFLSAMVAYSKQTLLYRQEELRSRYLAAVPDYTAIGICLETTVTVCLSSVIGAIISAFLVSPYFEKTSVAYKAVPSVNFKAFILLLIFAVCCTIVSIILVKKKPAE